MPDRLKITRETLERREEEMLAPYAARSGRSRGRRHPEPEHPLRTAFQRDRDRVIHSSAFRRLEYKTQVFVNHEGDHYRTRMTHSMEAAQIARTIARSMGLNEDLAEVLALAHDLGHTPFGHSGEEAMRDCMKEHGGFEHNLQSVRIVEELEERYPAFPGLNLTWETRESMRKHTIRPDYPVEAEYEPALSPLLETSVVDYSDSIAYDSHDIDDAVKAGLIEPESLEALELWQKAQADAKAMHGAGLTRELHVKACVRALIDRFVADLLQQTSDNLARLKIRSIDDVRAAKEKIVAMSPEMEKMKRRVEEFLHRNVYRHHLVLKMQEKAKRYIRDLFAAYASNVDQLPPRYRESARKVGVHRAVCDYIAGMTDRFAQDEYRRFFFPFENLL